MLKKIAILLSITLHLNAMAAYTPVSIKGQADASASNLVNLQTPNYQATKTGPNTYINETGNKNILSNPSFEHSTFGTGWTLTYGGGGGPSTTSAETSVVLHGLKAYKNLVTNIGGTTILRQSSTLYEAQLAGVQGVASGWFLIEEPTTVCAMQAGVVSTTDCVTINPSTSWQYVQIPFILGTTSNGISIVIDSVVNGSVAYLDDMFVGPASLLSNTDQSRIAGESYIAGTASCSWTRTSTTVGAFTTDADCPGPTVTNSTMGTWATTDADLPRQSITNLPAGDYEATFHFSGFVGTNNTSPVMAINDGTSTSIGIRGNGYNGAQIGQTVSAVFHYTSAGNRVFELYTATASGTSELPNLQTAPAVNVKFTLKYFGSGQVYTSQCGANCVDTFTATASSAGAILETNVPSWVGACSISGSGRYTCPMSFTPVDAMSCTCTPVVVNGDYICKASQAAGVAEITVDTELAGADTAQGFNVHCTKQGADFVATRTIQGSFKEVDVSPGRTKPKTCSVLNGGASITTVCSASPCTEYFDSCGTASPGVWSATGVQALTWAAGTFANSSYVECGASATGALAGVLNTAMITGSDGAITVSVRTFNAAPIPANAAWSAWCKGSAP